MKKIQKSNMDEFDKRKKYKKIKNPYWVKFSKEYPNNQKV